MRGCDQTPTGAERFVVDETLSRHRQGRGKDSTMKAAGAKAYSVGDYVWVFQNVIPPKGTKNLLKNGGDPS